MCFKNTKWRIDGVADQVLSDDSSRAVKLYFVYFLPRSNAIEPRTMILLLKLVTSIIKCEDLMEVPGKSSERNKDDQN